jgi:hypothetical protein
VTKLKRMHRSDDTDWLRGLAAKMDARMLAFEERALRAEREAIAAAYGLSHHDGNLAFERVLHAGLIEAIEILPLYPVDRAEFDRLPLLDASDEAELVAARGLWKWQIRSRFVLVLGNGSGVLTFFQPFMEEPLPLN